MTSKLDSLIDAGIAAQQAGRLDEALDSYQSALALAPGDAEVLSLFGLALTLANRLREAEPMLRDAVRREPEQAGFRMNLVEFLLRKGLPDEARTECLGIVDNKPGFLPARQKLAEIYIALDQPAEALEILNRIIKQESANPVLFNLACNAVISLQDWRQLETVSNDWTRSSPTDALAWQMLCKAYMEQGRYRLARNNYRHVLANRAENPEDLSIYGHICLQCFEFEEAASALLRGEELDPGNADLLVCMSLLYTYYGEFEKAEDYCRRAMQNNPDFVPAYTQLGHLLQGRLSDEEIDKLLRLQSDIERTVEHRIEIAFTLGSAYEARGNYQSAYQAYDLANRLDREQLKQQHHYDENESVARTGEIMALYRPDSIQGALQDATPCPIFIVGMPRSGTTLVEGTIAAHSDVVAGGERPLLPQITSAALSYSQQQGGVPAAETLKQWAGSYLSDLPGMGRANFFTDKNPLNIEAVGLIALLFPNAPIIHIRRNPVETCFSIFKHKFSKFWSFTHSLEDTAHFYGQYARLVSHWQALLGDRFLTIQYEDLASRFSEMAPVLVTHCGLEWEPQCLDVRSKNRAVPTLSAVQLRESVKVRQGMAENYQDFIQALINGLNSAGVDLLTGALIDAGEGTGK